MDKPFIYVASLRRTGSSMMRLLLTHPPESIVFGEPSMHKNKMKIGTNDLKMLYENGVELEVFKKEKFSTTCLSGMQFKDTQECVDFFKNEIVAKTIKKFSQVGIKEIRHKHWEIVLDAFPDTKAIVTARDPRDIYLSLYHKKMKKIGKAIFAEGVPITPENVADDLNREFEHQLKIANNCEAKLVRYEDFCDNENLQKDIRVFTSSQIDGLGALNRVKKFNYDLHDGVISSSSVMRWTKETNEKAFE